MANGKLNLEEILESVKVANEAKKDAQTAQGHSETNRTLILGALWVAVLGFIALLVTVGGFLQSYLVTKTTNYQTMIDKITEQNVKIDLLYSEFNSGKLTPTQSVKK